MLRPMYKCFYTGIRRFHTRIPLRLANQENPKISIEDPDEFHNIHGDKSPSTKSSELLYAYRTGGEVFGQLVNEARNGRDPLHNTRVLTPEELEKGVDPRYRDPQSGELLLGATSREARVNERNLRGRVNRSRIMVPELLSKVIQNNMLYAYEPRHLKQKCAEYYVKLTENGIQKPAEDEMDTDVSIATTFVQNYAVAYQVLDELKRRMGEDKFHPKRVLDYGYGPATGMLALNELMGDKFETEAKDVVINGDFHMMRRARLLLSRQICENTTEEDIKPSSDADDYVGKVKTKELHIKSILMNKFRPQSQKYDLIICERHLLTSQQNFPHEIDQKLDDLVKRLAPGGHLVLLERGNPLGAETIARARQVILRPESNENQVAKIPRAYKSYRQVMQEKLEKVDKDSEEYKEAMEGIEPEILENYDIVDDAEDEDETINLKITAPCSHHGKCPLQYFKPECYKYGQIGKKLKFCSFVTSVQRPSFLLELKRGSRLATRWDGEEETAHLLAGNGRSYCLDFERAHYSYLIVERSTVSESKLQEMRKNDTILRPIGFKATEFDESPRILGPPMKRKGLVTLDVCAPSGHAEKWYITKSASKQGYHDARKAKMGDLWCLGAKSVIQSRKENTFYLQKLAAKEKSLRESKKRDAERMRRRVKKKYKEALASHPAENDFQGRLEKMAALDAYQFLGKPKEQQRLKEKKRFK